MKITFELAFSGGQLVAECLTFDEADEVLRYALNRGIITVSVPDGNGGEVQADLTSNEEIVKKAKQHKTDDIAAAKTISPSDAAQAVKDYAAKNGVEAGRELLAKFGIKRTNEINETNAAEIHAAAKE